MAPLPVNKSDTEKSFNFNECVNFLQKRMCCVAVVEDHPTNGRNHANGQAGTGL